MEGDKAVAFNCDDIIKLMAACREYGVSDFDGGGINFSLVDGLPVRASVTTNMTPTVNHDYDQLLIEDPAAYEAALREID